MDTLAYKIRGNETDVYARFYNVGWGNSVTLGELKNRNFELSRFKNVMSNGRNLHSSDLTSLNRSICSDLIEINNDLAATAQFESTNDDALLLMIEFMEVETCGQNLDRSSGSGNNREKPGFGPLGVLYFLPGLL